MLILLTTNRRRVAIGLENGHILIYSSSSANPSEWELELTVDSLYVSGLTTSSHPNDQSPRNAHVDQIHRVAWRPPITKEERGGGIIKKQLASCSEDHTLRILNVLLKV
jgi:elongator complex protein 2